MGVRELLEAISSNRNLKRILHDRLSILVPSLSIPESLRFRLPHHGWLEARRRVMTAPVCAGRASGGEYAPLREYECHFGH